MSSTTMQSDFEQLVAEVNESSLSNAVVQQLTLLLKKQTNESLASFVSDTYQSLFILEHKIWRLLSQDSLDWFNHAWCSEFFETFATFNKKLIFEQDNIQDDIKMSLLIPEMIDSINIIFDKIEQSIYDDNPLITFACLWFDNLAYFVHEYPQSGYSSIIIHINQHFGQHIIHTDKFQFYLNQLQQSPLLPSIFTAKQLFYMKTCPFSLNTYFYTNPTTFDGMNDQVLDDVGQEYLQMIRIQSLAVDLWSTELLSCITHLIGFMRAYLWWDITDKGTKMKDLLPNEKTLCEYIQALIRILEYTPHYKHILAQWYNDETILMDSILLFLMNIVQTQNINWFFRSMKQLPDVLLKLAETSNYYRIYLCAYGILGEVLTDEHLKELKITESMRIFFFTMLEQAWHHPSKKYKQIPITYFLRGFLNLSKNDFIQEGTAKSNKISLFIEMCDQYPVAFDILWALSFNQDVQQQLRASSSFMSKLAHLNKTCDNEQMRKITHGILWNLEINHQDRSPLQITDQNSFDIMISYSHKEKDLCKQLFEQLIKARYRVWIDFDQMHGNVMDAMAQAIDRSQIIIICMSEQYRKSNYCRAEAHYAFQRQRKIVPVLMQKHYKPDGWLLFLVGQLLYVDFSKYEFARATDMLLKEIKAIDISEINIKPVRPKEDKDIKPRVLSASSSQQRQSQKYARNVLEWTTAQVHEWLLRQKLVKMARLLIDCDGRSLVHLYKYVKNGHPQQVLTLLQEDSRRRTNQSISLIELSRFHSVMHQLIYLRHPRKFTRSTATEINTEQDDF